MKLYVRYKPYGKKILQQIELIRDSNSLYKDIGINSGGVVTFDGNGRLNRNLVFNTVEEAEEHVRVLSKNIKEACRVFKEEQSSPIKEVPKDYYLTLEPV
jgi:hypothetical protein